MRQTRTQTMRRRLRSSVRSLGIIEDDPPLPVAPQDADLTVEDDLRQARSPLVAAFVGRSISAVAEEYPVDVGASQAQTENAKEAPPPKPVTVYVETHALPQRCCAEAAVPVYLAHLSDGFAVRSQQALAC